MVIYVAEMMFGSESKELFYWLMTVDTSLLKASVNIYTFFNLYYTTKLNYILQLVHCNCKSIYIHYPNLFKILFSQFSFTNKHSYSPIRY